MTGRCSFEAALFDLDGTLVDTLGDFVVALGRMLEEFGLPPVAAPFIRDRIGKGGEHLVHAVLEAVTHDAQQARAQLAAALASFRRHYAAVNGRHAALFPGVAAALRCLQERGVKLACVTNKPTGSSEALLRAMALDGYFEQVTGGDRFARMKPDPLPLRKTCELLGVAPSRTLMVGDSVNDAAAARAAGCRVALVDYGYSHGRPVREVDADRYLDSLDRLCAA